VAGAAAVLGDAAQRAELDADLDARAKGRPVYGGGAYYARTSGGYGRRCACPAALLASHIPAAGMHARIL
jgi:hypothetical protein